MKTASLLLCGALAIAAGAGARPVSESTAREAAAGFLSRTALAGAPLQLVYHPLYQHNPQHSTFFTFNAGSKGFVIVAGDDALHPVLAYSSEGSFSAVNVPVSVAEWLERYSKTASRAMDRDLVADEATRGEWEQLLERVAFKTTGSAVQQMLETRWGQDGYYNTACPWDNAEAAYALTGCTATSMSQIMRFWKYPATGTGVHSYTPANNPQYGVLTVDYSAATYDWSQMPVVANSNSSEVAKLMYHAGVSVNMKYSPSGSGAQVINFGGQINISAQNALVEHFGYKPTIEGLERDFMAPDRSWIPTLKMEINGGRPVLYVGFGSVGGHAFVADGYDVQDRLHINWGWDGMANGYFMVDAMDPAGSDFDDWQQALIGIEPAHSAVSLDLQAALNAPMFIGYKEPFTVKTKLANSGTAAFAGDYALRIFDTLGNTVDSIQIMSSQSLAIGSTTAELSFSSSGNVAMHPGVYWAGVYYRAQNGRWRQAGSSNGTYGNLRTIVVTTTTAVANSPAQPALRVHPNPAANFVQVLSPKDGQIRLLDLSGRLLAQEPAQAGAEVRLSTQTLPEGLYQLQVQTATGTETRKLLIKR